MSRKSNTTWRRGRSALALVFVVLTLGPMAFSSQVDAQSGVKEPKHFGLFKECLNSTAGAEKIIEICTRFIAIERQSIEAVGLAFLSRGGAYSSRRQNVDAIADYSEAIRIEPVNYFAWANRCFSRAVDGRDLEYALLDCRVAQNLRPDLYEILDSQGFIKLKLGRNDEAIADYSKALAKQPKLASALFGRGLARARKGDAKGAEADIAAAKAIKANVATEFESWGVKQ